VNFIQGLEIVEQGMHAPPSLDIEMELWRRGTYLVAGLDEVGRGALAGPVVVAAVILPPKGSLGAALDGVRDSKQLTPAQRQRWSLRIRALAAYWSIGWASNEEVDRYGIVKSVQMAALRALADLSVQPEHLLLDYMHYLDHPAPQTRLIKGDQRSLSIAAASIIAKVWRDEFLCWLDALYPAYGFRHNKGYGSRDHRQALVQFGPTPIHRRSFSYKKPA